MGNITATPLGKWIYRDVLHGDERTLQQVYSLLLDEAWLSGIEGESGRGDLPLTDQVSVRIKLTASVPQDLDRIKEKLDGWVEEYGIGRG